MQVTLKQRLRTLAPGLTPRAALEKFAALQMVDVHLPTTDGRLLILSRDTEPEKASLMPVLVMLTSGQLGPLLSPDPSDADDTRDLMRMTDLINDGYVAYIGLDSLSDGMVGSAIGSLLIAELTSIAGDRYNYGVNNKPVSVFIDEAAEVMNDPFVQLLNKGRGAGLRLTVATQSFADFAARTGSKDKATQVLANLNNLIALRVLDAETQTYITDSLPKIRLQTLMRTQASSTQSDNPLLYSGNAGERLIEEEGDLLPPALLGHLPNLEYIGRLAGGGRSRADCRSWWRRRRWRMRARRAVKRHLR